MQRKRDSDSSGHLEPVRKLNQQLAKVEATPTPTLLQQQAEKGNDKTQLQTEVAQLCQQLEETRAKIKARQQGATAVQRSFNDFLGQIQAGPSKTVQMAEDENKKLGARNSELLEVERTERKSTLRHLQKALAETQRDMATCEEMLEARIRDCDMMDDQRQRLQGRVSWLEARLRESEDESAQLRRSLQSQRASLLYEDSEVNTSPQQSREAQTETPNVEETETILRLLESVRQLQVDNGRLGDALKRQSGAMAELHEAEEALLMRAGLEKPLAQKARLEQAEDEAVLLRGRLEEAQNRAEDKEREVADVQNCFGNAFRKMRAEAVKMATSNTQLQELLEIERAESDRERSEREQERSKRQRERSNRERERSEIESYMLQLKQELDEARQEVLLYKVTSQEGSSERDRKFEEEKRDIQSYIGRLEGTLKESEAKCVQSEQQISTLISSLREKDCEVITSAQRLQEVFVASESMDQTIQLLRESVQQLESGTLRLEAASNEQVRRIVELEKEIDEAARVKRDLEERLQEMKRRSLNDRVESREMEVVLQDERNKLSETQELQKDLQAQLKQAERERLMLQQQLEDSQRRTELKDQALKDMQDFLTDTWLQRCSEGNVQPVEDRGTAVVAPGNAESQDLVERTDMGQDSVLRQLRKELADMQMKLSLCEESLEEKTLCCKDIALKNQGLQEDIGRFQRILQESEDKLIQSECSIFQLMRAMEEDKEVITFLQKPKEGVSVSTDTAETTESLRQLEGEKARLEETSRQQASRILELEKEVNEAVTVKRDLEERLQEMKRRSLNDRVESREMEVALQDERNKLSETQELQKDLQAQLKQAERERLMLQQQLEDSQRRTELKDQALKDMQDFLTDTWLQRCSEGNVQPVEDRGTAVVAPGNAESQDLVERTDMGQDSALRQLRKELADMQMKLSLCEESLEEKTLCCKDIALKNQGLQEDIGRFQRILQESEDKLIQSECSIFQLMRALEEDKEVITFLQKPKEGVSVSTDTAETTESLRQLEGEKARLEETSRQQASRILELEKEVNEAVTVKRDLEEWLGKEIQSSLPVNAPVEVRQKFSKAQKLKENLQEQLESVKIDRLIFRQRLREAKKISELRDLAVIDMQRCMNDTLEGMQAYSQDKIELAERRSKVFASEIAELQEQLEGVKTDSTLSQLQKELAKMRQKLSLCEELLEGKTLRCTDLEQEKQLFQKDVNALKEVLQQTKDQLERYKFNLKCAQKDKEPEAVAFSQKLQESVSTSTNTDQTMLVGSLQLLESEKFRLEEALKEQAGRIAELEQEVDEAGRVKKDLEVRLGEEMERQSLLSINDQVQASDTEAAVQDEGEKFSKAQMLQETEQVQSVGLSLQRQLEEAREMAALKDLASSDVQSCINDTLAGMEAYCQKIQLLESRSKMFASKTTELQEQLKCVKTDRGSALSELQKELAEMRQKLSLCEESLEGKTLRCRDLDEEKRLLQEDLNMLREGLQQTEEKYVQLELYNFNLKSALEDKECEDTAFAQLLESKNVDSGGLLGDLQKEMVDMQDKLSFCEESLEVKTRCCRELEEENLYAKEDMTTLRRILQEAEERHVQSEHCNFSLKCVLEDKEREVIALTLKLQEVASAPTDLEETVALADGSVQTSGSERTYRDSPPRLQSKPADVQTKLSLCEELLEEASRRCRDLEEENLGLQQDMNALRRMLQEGEENYVQLERHNFELKCALDDKGGEVISQGMQEFMDAVEAPVMKDGFEEQALREELQERVEYEAVPLRRHLEDVEEEVEEQISDVQNPFSSTVANTLAEYSRRVQPVEEVGNQPAGVDTDLQLLLEHEIPDSERELSQLPQGLAGALELLEIKIQKCQNLKEQLDMLRRLLKANERQNVRLELCIRDLRTALDSGEQKVIATSLKLHQTVTALSAAETTIVQLEESVSWLEAEIGELKAAARRQPGRVAAQRETAGTTKTERSHLENWLNRKDTKSMSQLEGELASLQWRVPSQKFS